VRRLDHVVLEVGAKAVLRAEDRAELETGRRGEAIDDMREIAVDRGRVGEDADLEPIEALRGEQSFRAKQHGVSSGSRLGRVASSRLAIAA